MSNKAIVLDLKAPGTAEPRTRELNLDSGRKIRVHSLAREEVVEIIERQGEASLHVRLTEEGPVVSLKGVRLELKSTESLTLEAKKVNIRAEDEAGIESGGGLDIKTSREMTLHSDDDIRVAGKMIHLN